MAESKVVKKTVEKVITVEKNVYQLTLTKDEIVLIGAMVGHINGGGYWREKSDAIWRAITNLATSNSDILHNPGIRVPISIDITKFDALPKEDTE